MYKVLVCDDEKDIVSAISIYLTSDGYEVIPARNGLEALDIVKHNDVHLVLMDIMMPVMDGIEAMVEIRKISNVPVILLTAKSEDTDKVLGLTVGADDYVTKPFSNRELLARIKAHLRRTETIETAAEESSNSGKQEISIGELIIVPDAFVAKKRGNEVELTHREFELLFHLATHMGQVMTREHLLETVWGYDYFGDVRTVDVTIRRLREKIEDTPSRPEYILTRRGVGYYMKNYD